MGATLADIEKRAEAWRRWLIHTLGLLLLMWPAVVNRQPFFFPDTTSYIRAADLAVRVATHQSVTTAWSNNDPVPLDLPQDRAPSARPAHASDGRGGAAVMSGRSPYFGALLYVGWVTSSFWLFVIAQALIGWWLIGLALSCVGLTNLRMRLAAAAVLGLATPLSIYSGVLLADGLAGLGILAFLILAADRPLAQWERYGVMLVVLASVVSHLTHIVMILAMTCILLLYLLLRRRAWSTLKRPIAIGAVMTIAGLLSVMATGYVVKRVLGRPPVLAPLLTARFVIDGPGRALIAENCGGQHFAVCGIASNARDSDVWLWSHVPGEGGFMAQDLATRDALSREDKAFARSVLAAYPLQQGGMMAWNTVLQLTRFDSAILREDCIARYACSFVVLPPAVRATMLASPAGRNAWPIGVIDLILAVTQIVAIAALAFALPRVLRLYPEQGRLLLMWVLLVGAAMLTNAFLGGAISAPQGRYQARIIWLIPLLATLAVARLRVLPHAGERR